ncbi:hypothetical protein O3Q51_06110 [Cryomorphaceae bacterium 1068]|nr:hypothetical protein [Cryomorphaceae bacterium 1068]
MTASKIVIFSLLCLCLQAKAQNSWTDFIPPKAEVLYTNYAAILFEGVPLWDGESKKNPLKVLQLRGKVTVNAVDRKTNKPIEGKALGFMIGLKDYDTNTVWMLSEKVYHEIDLEELQGKFDYGDVLLIMTVDRAYRLPRHELILEGGC